MIISGIKLKYSFFLIISWTNFTELSKANTSSPEEVFFYSVLFMLDRNLYIEYRISLCMYESVPAKEAAYSRKICIMPMEQEADFLKQAQTFSRC